MIEKYKGKLVGSYPYKEGVKVKEKEKEKGGTTNQPTKITSIERKKVKKANSVI